MRYSHIVFDIDGTLLDTETAVLSSLQRLLQDLWGRVVPRDDLRFALGITGEDALETLHIDASAVPAACALWDDYYRDCAPETHVFPEIEAVLEQLVAQGKTLGVITSKTRREFALDFLPFGLSHYFSVCVCADDTARHKPDPAPMLHYISCAGASVSQTLYVGDSVYDMCCARDAGVDCALALWGCKNPDEIDATYKLSSPALLLK